MNRFVCGLVYQGFFRIAAAAAVLAGVAACQTNSSSGPPAISLEEAREAVISLKEAKKITAAFSGSLTAPPRTINYILTLADQVEYLPEHCSVLAPLSPEEVRAGFLAMSSRETMDTGRVVRPRIAYLMGHAVEQFYKGNTQLSIKYLNWALEEEDDMVIGKARSLAQLAAYHAYAGNFDESDNILSDVLSRLPDLPKYGDVISRQRNLERGLNYDWSLLMLDFHVAEIQGANAASKGKLKIAEAYYREAIEISENKDAHFDFRFQFSEIALGQTLMRQGRLLEAESILREQLKNHLPFATPGVAVTFLRFSETLYEQGRYLDAERSARATVKMFEGICTAPGNLQLAEARNVLAKALVAQEQWNEALIEYEAIQTGLADDPGIYERRFSGNLYKALALLRIGQLKDAGDALLKALQRSKNRLGVNHYTTAEISGFLAMIHYAKGAHTQALATFADAIRILLARSREAGAEGDTMKARDQRLRLILESYMRLLNDMRAKGLENPTGLDVVSTMFQLAESIRSRAVQRALTASGSRAALKDPVLSDLARREQDTKKRITVVYGTLARELSRPTDNQSSARIGVLKATIGRLRAARSALIAEIEKRFPDYAELIDPKPLSIESVQANLRPGEALISTYVGEERTYVWAVPYRGDTAFGTVAMGREELFDEVDLIREALDPGVTRLGDIPVFDVARAHALYAKLLVPVEAGWRDAKSLLVVAHGPLGSLPFSVLPTKLVTLKAQSDVLFSHYRNIPWLARSHAVTNLPSVGSLKTLRGLPPGDAGRRAFAGFGDPWFSQEQAKTAARPQQVAAGRGVATRRLSIRLRAGPGTENVDSAELALLPRLPETAEEVRSMALAMNADPAQSIFIGKDATEGRVKEMDLSNVRVIAFATHGLVPGDLNGLLQPALALSSPRVVGGKDDGLLTMGEILGLKLNADWVVLSACNTGSGEGEGAEAVSGLGMAFFYAGTRALLVSNWPVETTSAKALTTDLFRRQAANDNLGRAEALRQTMIGLLDGDGYVDQKTGKVVFSYAHPLFWAPFTIVGDGQGTRPTT